MGKMGLQWIEYRKYSGEKNTQEMSQKYQTRLRKIEGKGLRGTKHNTAPDVREALENPQQWNPLAERICLHISSYFYPKLKEIVFFLQKWNVPC